MAQKTYLSHAHEEEISYLWNDLGVITLMMMMIIITILIIIIITILIK